MYNLLIAFHYLAIAGTGILALATMYFLVWLGVTK
jgi:hypothetical protein